jgi:hypothetical protein
MTFGDLGKLFIVTRAGAQVVADLQPLGSGGAMRLLPADTWRRRRFYVHTRPADDSPMGLVGCQELTIVRWDGKQARRLLWKSYFTYKGEAPAFDGHVVALHTKGEIRWFSTNSSDDAFDAIRRIVVDPAGVHDQGLEYANPEYALVDELFRQVSSGNDVSEFASRQARAVVESVLNDLVCIDDDCPSLGLLLARRVDRSAHDSVVRLESEEIPGTFEFAIEDRHGRPYIAEALRAPPAPVVARPRR